MKIRSWLNRNKIFFEISSSLLLGVAGIFVAYASYQVSTAQLEISRIATEPHFYVDTVLIQSPETQDFDNEEMYVQNAGAPAHNISVSARTFISVDLFEVDQDQVFVPVLGYFSGKFQTYEPVGLIVTFKGHLNNHHAARLYFSVMNPDVMKGRPFFAHTFFTITEISYKNALGEDRVEYFRNSSQISAESAKPFLKQYDEQVPLELSAITVDALLEAVRAQTKL